MKENENGCEGAEVDHSKDVLRGADVTPLVGHVVQR